MKIAKILSIKDTRQKAEQDGKFVAIPGTGDKVSCALCGHSHEIHALAMMDDGSTANVGIGCAKKSAPVAYRALTIQTEIDKLMDKRAALLDENHEECVSQRWGKWVTRCSGLYCQKVWKELDSFESHAIANCGNGKKIKACKEKMKALAAELASL